MIDWGSWRSEPILVGLLVLLGWLYALATGPFRSRLAPGAAFPGLEAKRFYGGLGILYIAWCSPLDLMARYFLCSAHAFQDVLVLFPASVLLVLGLPAWVADPLLGAARPLARLVLHPVTCAAAFIILLSGWYLPRLFEPALRSDRAHALQAGSFLAAGILFWWPLVGRSAVAPPLRFGGRMAYLFAAEVALTGVFTYILMAEHGIYATYGHAPRLFAGLTPSEDQVLAGVLLSGLSSFVLVGALAVNFFRWARTESHPAAA